MPADRVLLAGRRCALSLTGCALVVAACGGNEPSDGNAPAQFQGGSTSTWRPPTGGSGTPTGWAGGTGGVVNASGGFNPGTGGTPGSGAAPFAPPEDPSAYLDAHNAVRAAVVEPANYSGAWSPLPPLSWSSSLAAEAQARAETLRDTAGCRLSTTPSDAYGENLVSATGQLTAGGAVAAWAGEKVDFTFGPYDGTSASHYSQLVWRTTSSVGCGSASCSTSSVICCLYAPKGDRAGELPY